MITIINYNMGNLRSVFNKFKHLGVECSISSDREEITKATKLILPGVGHFGTGMKNLIELDLVEILYKKVIKEKTPILGICLGAQLFTKYSEECDCEGLGWIDAEVVRFNVSDKIKYKVPHIGWNNVEVINSNKLDNNLKKDGQFYFVHSYHLKCNNVKDIWMKTEYDYQFVSAIRKDNIYATQFHPEKSHDVGIELLKQFSEL